MERDTKRYNRSNVIVTKATFTASNGETVTVTTSRRNISINEQEHLTQKLQERNMMRLNLARAEHELKEGFLTILGQQGLL